MTPDAPANDVAEHGAVAMAIHEARRFLPVMTVYKHPADYPDQYVARLWFTLPENRPTNVLLVSPDLEVIRSALRGMGLFVMPRHPADEPHVVETWL